MADALRRAVAEVDSAAVARLDGAVRDLVAHALSEDGGAAGTKLEALRDLYAELITATEGSRRELSEQISAHQSRRRGVSAYVAALGGVAIKR